MIPHLKPMHRNWRLWSNRAWRRLELYAGKLARTVLREERPGNGSFLPDKHHLSARVAIPRPEKK
ncbi:hypothetical protein RvVAR0630_pl06490 (plasmid) [Agrobacterium vitis]|nr:hypothetical protein RvVAR0630_pl06490 [Agrobacterium vitis]